MSSLLGQGEPPRDANGWIYWLLTVVGGGGLFVIGKLAKMIKTADTSRIETLEKVAGELKKESDACKEDREKLNIRVAKLEERNKQCVEQDSAEVGG